MSSGRTVLIADDDPDLRDIIRSILETEGFRVTEAPDGKKVMELVRSTTPDLLVLDNMMPGMTGVDVCRKLKEDVLLAHVPIIMLTGKSETQDKVEGLAAGADDYIVKPFDPQELMARINMVLRRTAQELEANPLTRLPGNNAIQRELETRIAENKPLAVAYVDLDRFKAFNDHYGFQRGDEIIKRTARILLECSRSRDKGSDFVGHIGGDDFVVVTTPNYADDLCKKIISEFDTMSVTLFDEKERKQGYFLHRIRMGKAKRIPLLSVSIALVTNEKQPITHPGQVASIAAELKQIAKQSETSTYVKDRRSKKK